MKCLLIVVGALTVSDASAAPNQKDKGKAAAAAEVADFDFYLVDRECRLMAASVGDEGEDGQRDLVSSMPGEAGLMGCDRAKDKVTCTSTGGAGASQAVFSYRLALDTATLMTLENDTRSEVAFLNPAKNSGIFVTRTFSTPKIGEGAAATEVPVVLVKMCKVRYLTRTEMKILLEKKSTSPSK